MKKILVFVLIVVCLASAIGLGRVSAAPSMTDVVSKIKSSHPEMICVFEEDGEDYWIDVSKHPELLNELCSTLENATAETYKGKDESGAVVWIQIGVRYFVCRIDWYPDSGYVLMNNILDLKPFKRFWEQEILKVVPSVPLTKLLEDLKAAGIR